jgi:ornithine carbamoyltransferase
MRRLFERATRLKHALKTGQTHHTLKGKMLGMIFEKPSTRTRVSFEAGMFQLGGQGVFLSAKELQLGRGEPIKDSARVLSRYLDGLMVRTFGQSTVEIMAEYASVPVINGLTDLLHPCQLLADLFTFEEFRGPITGRKVAWIGDGNNMANSWIQAAALARFHLTLCCPANYEPDPDIMTLSRQIIQGANDVNASITLIDDPVEAVDQADLVTTDVWTSMGQEEESQRRLRAFEGYRVTGRLMAEAQPDALFLHCLPAHRGEEVAEEVLEGPWSVVWDEAENRMHVQKAVLEWLMADDPSELGL